MPGTVGPPGALDDEVSTIGAEEVPEDIRIRSLDELDIDAVTAIDERISGTYRPHIWERRVGYYLRRDPDAPVAAEVGGEVVGFMLGEVRSGEFGLDEPTGWIEVMGIDPDHQGRALGRHMAETMLEHFRERGATTVRTLVDEAREDLSGFFRALGFEPAPLRPFVRRLATEDGPSGEPG